MNDSLKEKLSLLSELIKLAKADKDLRTAEFEFLYAIAKQLEVSDEVIQKLLFSEVP